MGNTLKKISTGLLAMLALLLWTPHRALAFTPWTGRITANINLRAAPGLNGRIITGMDRDAVVQVRARQGDWYQIERETETFGYIGWVYGKYVVALGTARPDVPEPAAAPARPAGSSRSAESPAPAPVRSAATSPLPTPQKAPTPAKETVPPMPAPAVAVPVGVASAAPAAVPATVSPAPSASTVVGAAPEAGRVAATAMDTAPPRHQVYAGPRAVLGLALRLATVVISCLALLLAFRAFQTARQTAMKTARSPRA